MVGASVLRALKCQESPEVLDASMSKGLLIDGSSEVLDGSSEILDASMSTSRRFLALRCPKTILGIQPVGDS